MSGTDRPLRLCYIANPNSIHTLRWLRYFVEVGHEVHLIPDRVPRSQLEGIKLHPLSRLWDLPKLRYAAWGLQARRLVRTIRPDILHAHQAISAGWIGAATGFHPFLITSIGSDLMVFPYGSRFNRLLTRLTLGRADLVIAVSRDLRRKAVALGVHQDKLEVVRLGTDLDAYHPEGDTGGLRKALKLGHSPVILSARAMSPIYNQLVVARAIPLILGEVPEAKFIFWRYNVDQGYLEDVEGLIRKSKLGEAVRFVGPLSSYVEGADYYRLAEVMVSVPSSDGSPLTVSESMACGTPVVASDLPSVRESIGHNENGLLIPVGDPEALAAAVVRLLGDPELRRKLRQKGLAFVREHGDHQKNMARVEEIYQRLSGAKFDG